MQSQLPHAAANTQLPHNVCILGVTGSIGKSTLQVLRLHPYAYTLHSVSAYSQISDLVDICVEFSPKVVAIPAEQVDFFSQLLRSKSPNSNPPAILTDKAGLVALVSDTAIDTVVSAIVGAAGLMPTYQAVTLGKKVLLANKEALVMAGNIMLNAAEQHGSTVLPLDSEHNAIFQCLPSHTKGCKPTLAGVSNIVLTASGGPFRAFTAEQLTTVTPEQACKHPNWSMGRKISIDSATLMNKGLELIEACYLFNVPQSMVEVVVHPQSIIHSMVQYDDGSTLAQLGNPDMCTPIAHALAWPERIASGVSNLTLIGKNLTFEAPDLLKFPALSLARQAFDSGQYACIALNAANEVAVDAFLQGKIGFTDISAIVADTLHASPPTQTSSIASVVGLDNVARTVAAARVIHYRR